MKYLRKMLILTIVLLAAVALGTPAKADMNVRIGFNLDLPSISFHSPPQMVVLPDTYIYVVPDIDDDIYFVDGWWWRPWHGNWYRSRNYDRGWRHYSRTPHFYRDVPHNWRHEYRNNSWKGHRWNHQRNDHQQVNNNWQRWKRDKYWEREKSWGVENRKPRSRHDRNNDRRHYEEEKRKNNDRDDRDRDKKDRDRDKKDKDDNRRHH